MAETITSITERLLAEVPEQYDTTEGTYTYDIENLLQSNLTTHTTN